MITPRWLVNYLHPGEQIIHLIQHSWVTMFLPITGCLTFILIPIITIMIVPNVIDYLQTNPVVWAIVILGGSLYYFGLLLFLLIRYVDYHLDFWIITNERLMSIEQKGLFTQKISEQELVAIQDITSSIRGLLATVLNFGNVEVRTASERQSLLIDEVSNPHLIRRQLFQILEQKRLKVVSEKISTS